MSLMRCYSRFGLFNPAGPSETARRFGVAGMRIGTMNSGGRDVKPLREGAGGVRLALDRHERSARIGEPAIRPTVSILVERRRFDDPRFVGFPLIGSAVVIRIFFGGGHAARVVVLPAINCLVVRD